MLQNGLVKQLVEKAKACENGDFMSLVDLHAFLDSTPHMLLFEAVCHELTLREPNLTDAERDAARLVNYTFYDECDKPVDHLVRHNEEEDGLLPDA